MLKPLIAIVLLITGTQAVAQCKWVDELNKSESKADAIFQTVRTDAFAGDTKCQMLLASMYGYGIGTESNEKTAHRWNFIAALLGEKVAYSELARLFAANNTQNIYDPVLVYALHYASQGTQREKSLEFWGQKLKSSFESEEAERIGKLLSR